MRLPRGTYSNDKEWTLWSISVIKGELAHVCLPQSERMFINPPYIPERYGQIMCECCSSSAGASIMNSDQPWYVMHLNEASTSKPSA